MHRLLAAFAALALLAATAGGAEQRANPYLDAAARLYQNLEFQEALRTVERGLMWPNNTPEETVRASLLEGIIVAQMGQVSRATTAFKRALAIEPSAKLPFRVSPKISKLFEQARREIGAAAAKQPPATTPSPTPVAPKPVTTSAGTASAVPTPAPTPPPLLKSTPEKTEPSTTAAWAAQPPSPVSPSVRTTTAQQVEPERGAVQAPALTVKPSKSEVGPLVGVSFVGDVVGRSFGAEVHGGFHFGGVQVSCRVRPGSLIGVGLLVGYDFDTGPLELILGLRGDVYLGRDVIPGGGLMLELRRGLFRGFGVKAGGSLEAFVAPSAAYRPLAGVLSVGVDWRW